MSEYIDLAKCIIFLQPEAEFALNANSYDQLIWFSNSEKPSEKELLDAWPAVLTAEKAKQDEANAKRATALAKLEALGLEIEDLKALGLG